MLNVLEVITDGVRVSTNNVIIFINSSQLSIIIYRILCLHGVKLM